MFFVELEDKGERQSKELVEKISLAEKLQTKLQNSQTKTELHQVNYARLKDTYDTLLSDHQVLSKENIEMKGQIRSSSSLVSSLSSELDIIKHDHLKSAIENLQKCQQEMSVLIEESHRWKSDCLYYQMSLDEQAKKYSRLQLVYKERAADLEALGEEYYKLLGKVYDNSAETPTVVSEKLVDKLKYSRKPAEEQSLVEKYGQAVDERDQ